MNFIETLKSVALVLACGDVPLIVGESGIGKTALAKQLAKAKDWVLITIDGNLLKEGEIGGLPIVEDYTVAYGDSTKKTTVYAVHHKLRQIDEARSGGKEVLLFIDEINRCEHAVQQELMNLILNREINGYHLPEDVKIIAAMNPTNKYSVDFDYQVVEMDPAQENRFVWLQMESDVTSWTQWAMDAGIDEKVIAFIATFPEYLYKKNAEDLCATPRSYERISKSYQYYKEDESIPRSVFLNVLKGNVGRVIAEAFLSFIEADYKPLISYQDVCEGDGLTDEVIQRIQAESHTRLHLAAHNVLREMVNTLQMAPQCGSELVERLMMFLNHYPLDLKVGMMKEMKRSYDGIYQVALENESFVEAYFEAYGKIRG